MKFYFVSNDGTERRELNSKEVRERLTEFQIGEAIAVKCDCPDEEVSYMTAGGYIILDN